LDRNTLTSRASYKPWSAGDAAGSAVPLRANGKPYRGVNVLILWMEAMANEERF
jgi:antirestriction protein ArdC